MKTKLSITVDEETVKAIEQALQEGRFRNKSHALEYAIRKLLDEKIRKNFEK